jgi:hypothetical protein
MPTLESGWSNAALERIRKEAGQGNSDCAPGIGFAHFWCVNNKTQRHHQGLVIYYFCTI